MKTKLKKRTLIDVLADSNVTPFGIAIAVFIVWGVITYVPYNHYFRADHSDWAGQFGDMFGVVNSLFSGFAVAGLAYSVILQKKELKMTRKELSITKRENTKQSFESIFFSMLQLHITKVDQLTYGGKIGRQAFEQLYLNYGIELQTKLSKKHDAYAGSLLTLEETLQTYLEVFSRPDEENAFGHYFRNLYQIFLIIDESAKSINKYKYAKIVRAQLSSIELTLLFYNCLTTNGNQKFKPLIEKYSVLKQINKTLLWNTADTVAYKKTAFEQENS